MEHYFRSALAPSSQHTYGSAQTRYLQFCSTFSLSPLPVNELQFCQFAVHLANEQLSHTTIKKLPLSSWEPPNCKQLGRSKYLRYAETGRGNIKYGQAKTKQNQRTRLPITPSILLQMCNNWEQQVETT